MVPSSPTRQPGSPAPAVVATATAVHPSAAATAAAAAQTDVAPVAPEASAPAHAAPAAEVVPPVGGGPNPAHLVPASVSVADTPPQNAAITPSTFIERLAPASLAASRDSYAAAIDPVVRGTRPTNGTTTNGAALGEGQFGTAGLHLTPFGLQLQGGQAHGHGASVTLDRHSALGSAQLPLGHGNDVALTGGAVANLLYANATVHDANGTGLGVLAVLTHAGSPGIGASITHVGAHFGVAAAPAVVFDRTAKARVRRLEAQPGHSDPEAPPLVAIEQKHTRSLAGNLPLSFGHAGFAGSVRVSGDAREQFSYTYRHPLATADERAPQHGRFRQRLEAVGAFRQLPKLPTLAEVFEGTPGTKLKVAVETSASVGVGVSLGGVQLIGAAVRSQQSEASVERPAETAGQGDAAAATKVVLSETRSQGKFAALDVPGLLSASLGRQNVATSTVGYALSAAHAATGAALVTRNDAVLGLPGHFCVSGVDATNMADVRAATATFARLHAGNTDLERVTYAAVQGGHSAHVGALQLGASLAGPRLGLSLTRDRGRQVHYASASKDLTMVAFGTQQRRQRELPIVGGLSQQLEVLRVTTQLRGDRNNNAQLDLVRFNQKYTHAKAPALAKVQGLLHEVTTKAPACTAEATPTLRPPVAMDLELQLQFEVLPETIDALATRNGLLAGLEVPPPGADQLTRQSFYKTGLAQLHATVRQTPPHKAQPMLAALARANARATWQLDSNLFPKLQKKAVGVVKNFFQLRRTYGPAIPPRRLRRAATQAVEVAKDLQDAQAMMRAPMFADNDPKLRRQQLEAVDSSLKGIVFAFHPTEAAEREQFPQTFTPRTSSAFAQLHEARERLMPPPVAAPSAEPRPATVPEGAHALDAPPSEADQQP